MVRKESSTTQGPLPSGATSGREALTSRQNIGAAIASATAAVLALLAAPDHVFEPAGCAAFGYVLFVFCFQNCFIEWPEVGPGEQATFLAALGALAAPTLLQNSGFWQRGVWRAAALALDALLILACYLHMVKGPVCRPRGGSLLGRTCVVTGCNTGIGFETAASLARAGARVVFACRSEQRARAAMWRLVVESKGAVDAAQLVFLPLDVASLASVRRFVSLLEGEQLTAETLVLNAGVMMGSRQLSEDGFEMTMASNHFGHFLLVQLLLPSLLAAEQQEGGGARTPRIVVMGSNICYRHDGLDFEEVASYKEEEERQAFLRRPHSIMWAYGHSKLANLLFTVELARRLRRRGSSIPANAVHPGEALTEVAREMPPVLKWLQRWFSFAGYAVLKSPRQAANCTLHVATDPGLATADGASGQYFMRARAGRLSRAAQDVELASKLWEVSEALTGAPGFL